MSARPTPRSCAGSWRRSRTRRASRCASSPRTPSGTCPVRRHVRHLPRPHRDLPLPRAAAEADGRHLPLDVHRRARERGARRPPRPRRRGGRSIDIDQLLLFTIRDGLVTEVLALPSDPAAFDGFWARAELVHDRIGLRIPGSELDLEPLDPRALDLDHAQRRPSMSTSSPTAAAAELAEDDPAIVW